MNRSALALCAALVGALALPAAGAPAKALCFQISDPEADFGMNGTPLTPASLDLVSADVATGPKNLVATVRLKSLARDAYQATGTAYAFTFTLGGAKQSLSYAVTATGSTVSTYTYGSGAGEKLAAPVTVDLAAATITWTVPRKSVPGLKTAGASLSELAASSSSTVHLQEGGMSFSFASGADEARTATAYKDGTATCLKGA